jgi:hypothetical protein
MSKHNRTQFALQALGLAETFNATLASERVRGAVTYRVELSAPDGPSTAGGKQSTQHVKLIPEGGESGSGIMGPSGAAGGAERSGIMGPSGAAGGAERSGIIVAGSANQVEGWAELRSFEHLKRLHAQRFHGAEIPLNRVQYDELLGKLRAFFADRGCAPRMAALPDGAPGRVVPARTTSGTLVLFAIFGLAALSAAVVVWFFKHR